MNEFPQPGTAPLDNQAAKAIAEKLMRELWTEFHPMATTKVLGNMERIFQREMKTVRVRYQIEQAQK